MKTLFGDSPDISRANKLSRNALQSCITTNGITAGTHHFVDLWARDSLFATFGLSSKKELPAAKITLETFLQYQRHDGLIPYRILRSKASFSKYFGKPAYLSSPKPNFRSYQSGGIVPDGGLMTIIAASEYMKRSGDRKFLVKQYGNLRRAMTWYIFRFQAGLIREWFLCEWADAVLKSGHVLYTNILYWQALGDFSRIAGLVKNQTDAKVFRLAQVSIGEKIQKQFWTGAYFADWIDWKRQDYLSSHGNLLAIVFGFCTHKQSLSILSQIKRRSVRNWSVETNDPVYPWWRIPIWNYLVGMGDYHNRGCFWLQTGILYVLALDKAGKHKEAGLKMQQIAAHIVRWNGVYEVYERNGHPVRRMLYRSEHPFAWSAGLFLWAARKIAR